MLKNTAIILPFRLFAEPLRRDWYLRLFFASLLILAGSGLSYFSFSKSTLVSIIGLSGILGAVKMFSLLVQQRTLARHPVIQQLELQPLDIVWIYTVHTQRMPFGLKIFDNGLLYLKLINGKDHCISLPAGKLKLASHFLHRHLPHVSVGYNEERAQWYRVAPELLLQPNYEEED